MKKYFVLSAVAALALASCTSEDAVETGAEGTTTASQAITIGGQNNAFTRATHYGADAASLLGKHFTVEGSKHDPVANKNNEVFDDFLVKWTANTAGTTESNTSDWEYVGITAVAPSSIEGIRQAVKYWDYSTDQYDFAAYTTGAATAITSGDPQAGEVLVSAIDYDHLSTAAYTLRGATADLANCYIADLVTAYNPTVASQPAYQDEVTFTFRNLASKVRVALYETVRGYSVKNVKFYSVDGGATPTDLGTASETNATLFTTGATASDKFFSTGTYTVSFPTIGKTNVGKEDYNKAHVAFTADTNGAALTQNWGALNYKGKEYNEKTGTQFLGRNSNLPSFAGTDPYWKTVLPNEDGAVLELRVDYTLESIDGTGEEINVYGATAFVPAIFAAWKSNYAYTYLFKISDSTNGWTSKVVTDPKGLYPITFDAVTLDAVEGAEQTTVTTVATPSVTTYQKGHLYSDGNVYDASKGDIYVQVMADKVLKTDLGSKGKLYSLNEDATEAAVLSALNLRAIDQSAADIVGRNGLELSEETCDATIEGVPGVNGNTITVTPGTAASFTASANTTYAYVYTVTAATGSEPIVTAVNVAVDFDFDAAETANANDVYYTDEACTVKATGTAAEAGIYYQKYLKNNGVYAIKVIKTK